MGYRTVARLGGNHLQNIAMLAGLDIGWPQGFKDLFNWTRIFNIDLAALLVKLRLPTITQRLIFIAVSIALPLSLMVLTALVFFSISAIMQIALLVCSLGLLVLHTMSFANDGILSAEYNSSVGSETALWVSFAAVLTVIMYRIVRRKSYDAAQSLLWIGSLLFGLTVLDAGPIAKRIVLSLFAVLYCTYAIIRAEKRRILVLFGVAVMMAIIVWVSGLWRVSLPPQLQFTGWAITGLAGISIISRVVTLLSSVNQTGSAATTGTADQQKKDEGCLIGFLAWVTRMKARVSRLLDTGLLTLILFIFAMVYAPVITNALQLFVCETYTCPPGYAFNPHVNRPENEPYTTSPAVFCELCNFTSACGFSTYDMCPGFSSRRLLYDPATTCDDSSYAWFIGAACLVLIVFIVIIQIMYVKVISMCTNVTNHKARTGYQRVTMHFREELSAAPIAQELDAPPSFEDKWEDVCIRVAPKASSLYDAYRFTLRYFILIESAYKTIEVLATTFLSPISPAASIVALAAHLVFFFVLVLLTPFRDTTEQWLSVLLTFCMVLNSIYAVFMWHMPDFFGKDGWSIGMLVFNVIVPFIGGVYLLYVSARNQFCRKTLAEKKKEEEEKEEKEREMAEKARRQRESRREKTQRRMQERNKLLQQKLLAFERMYGNEGGSPVAGDGQAAAATGQPEEKKKTAKELKREQMTPSEKLGDSLNTFTKKVILVYFAALGIPLLCGALVLTLMSGSVTGNTSFVDSSSLFDRSRATTLNNYYSWDEFSATCCCFESFKFTTRGSNRTERWMCMDFINRTASTHKLGASFFRTRIDNAGNDGLAMRPFCAVRTVPQCVASVQVTDTVKMECEPEYAAASNLTEFAIEVLW